MCPIVLKSGSLNLLEPSGPSQGLLFLNRYTYLIAILVHAKKERVAFKFILRKKISAVRPYGLKTGNRL
jgi:hypothetical protein